MNGDIVHTHPWEVEFGWVDPPSQELLELGYRAAKEWQRWDNPPGAAWNSITMWNHHVRMGGV